MKRNLYYPQCAQCALPLPEPARLLAVQGHIPVCSDRCMRSVGTRLSLDGYSVVEGDELDLCGWIVRQHGHRRFIGYHPVFGDEIWEPEKFAVVKCELAHG